MTDFDFDFDAPLQPFTIEVGSDHVGGAVLSVSISGPGDLMDRRPTGASWVDLDDHTIWTNYGTEEEPNWQEAGEAGPPGTDAFQPNIQDFYEDGTWVKPDGATIMHIIAIGAGGGGGGGNAKSAIAPSTYLNGGGGGGAGGRVEVTIPVIILEFDSYSVQVGALGNGGTGGQSTDPDSDTPPTDGVGGGTSTVYHDDQTLIVAGGGSGGGSGSNAFAGPAGFPLINWAALGVTIAGSGGACAAGIPGAGDTAFPSGTGGGAGGGIDSATQTDRDGVTTDVDGLGIPQPAAGIAGGGTGGDGGTSPIWLSGCGGAGGGSNADGDGGLGGSGGVAGGGGGGGAGIIATGQVNGGDGGHGGPGFVRVICL